MTDAVTCRTCGAIGTARCSMPGCPLPQFFAPGDKVGCHPGLFERPGTVLGPGTLEGTYRVDILGLGRMDVPPDQLRLMSRMQPAERDRLIALAARHGG